MLLNGAVIAQLTLSIMKLLSKDEVDAHRVATITGGIKGAILGAAVSFAIFGMARNRLPKNHILSTTVKASIFTFPTAGLTNFFAEQNARKLDKEWNCSDYSQLQSIKHSEEWQKLSLGEKGRALFENNRGKVMTGLWGMAMLGSWVCVNNDKFLTRSQKFYHARMYAQWMTLIFLVTSIGFSVNEKKEDTLDKGWKEFLDHQVSKSSA